MSGEANEVMTTRVLAGYGSEKNRSRAAETLVDDRRGEESRGNGKVVRENEESGLSLGLEVQERGGEDLRNHLFVSKG